MKPVNGWLTIAVIVEWLAGPRDRPARPMTMLPTRRQFLAASLQAGLALPALHALEGVAAARPASPSPGSPLAARFRDLRHHFIFEYYPWYSGPPAYTHWDFWDRHPPLDISSRYMPRLGAYDVRDKAVLEQQA